MTRRLVQRATAVLAAAGVASPEYDAAELLAHVLGTSRSALSLVDVVEAHQCEAYDVLVARRAAREPLQHLTGSAAFRHVEVAVGPGVFVPRPETELLAGWAVERAGDVAATGRAPVVVDLCTGSGAIALAVASEVPAADVHAVELGDTAYEWACRNLAGSGVDLRHGDMADAFPDLDARVDVVVCNPPYIPLEAFESVAPEARDHDPALALFAGPDGLDDYRRLAPTIGRLIAPGALAAIEIGHDQAGSASALFEAAGHSVRLSHDLGGRARALLI